MNMIKNLILVGLVLASSNTLHAAKMSAEQAEAYANQLMDEIALLDQNSTRAIVERCDRMLAIPQLADSFRGYALWISGMLYFNGTNEIAKNYTKALERLEAAIPLVAHFASKTYTESSLTGEEIFYYPIALSLCGYMWHQGDETIKPDVHKALEYYQMLAANNEFIAPHEVLAYALFLMATTKMEFAGYDMQPFIMAVAFAKEGMDVTAFTLAQRLAKEGMNATEIENAVNTIVAELTTQTA